MQYSYKSALLSVSIESNTTVTVLLHFITNSRDHKNGAYWLSLVAVVEQGSACQCC